MRIRRFLHLILFVVAVLLLWQGVSTWSHTVPVPLPHATPGATAEPPLVIPPARSPDAGEQFAEVIADKDLFAPTRRRATVEGPQATSVPPPSHLKLVGVLMVADRQEALFMDSSQGGKVVRIRPGEAIGSYRLTKLTPGYATLALGQEGGEVTLPLTVLDSATAAQAPQFITAIQRPGIQGRRGPLMRGQPIPGQPGQPIPVPQQPTREETQAIRQNIQRLQQRLRQMRRQAAPKTAEEPDTGDGEEDSGDEEMGEEE